MTKQIPYAKGDLVRIENADAGAPFVGSIARVAKVDFRANPARGKKPGYWLTCRLDPVPNWLKKAEIVIHVDGVARLSS